MKFVADECVDKEIVASIRLLGFEVMYIADLSQSADDDFILNFSNSKNAILITYDKDFGELIFRQKKISSGLILLRFEGLPAQLKAEIINDLIRNRKTELQNAFTVITDKHVRLRRFEP